MDRQALLRLGVACGALGAWLGLLLAGVAFGGAVHVLLCLALYLGFRDRHRLALGNGPGTDPDPDPESGGLE